MVRHGSTLSAPTGPASVSTASVQVAGFQRLEPTGRRLVVGDLELDPAARRARLASSELALRPKEFDLLALLMAEAGHAVARERIMSEVWDEHWFGSTKTLDMHIAALRRKLGEQGDGHRSRITTLRGVGYRLELEPS